MTAKKRKLWVEHFEPSRYLGRTKMPVLFVNSGFARFKCRPGPSNGPQARRAPACNAWLRARRSATGLRGKITREVPGICWEVLVRWESEFFREGRDEGGP